MERTFSYSQLNEHLHKISVVHPSEKLVVVTIVDIRLTRELFACITDLGSERDTPKELAEEVSGGC